MAQVDEQGGQAHFLGPAAGDTLWVLAIHALGASGVPTAAERSKLTWIRGNAMSDRLKQVIDAVLARS